MGTTALGWILCGTLFAGVAVWLAYLRPWQQQDTQPEASTGGAGSGGKEGSESLTSPPGDHTLE